MKYLGRPVFWILAAEIAAIGFGSRQGWLEPETPAPLLRAGRAPRYGVVVRAEGLVASIPEPRPARPGWRRFTLSLERLDGAPARDALLVQQAPASERSYDVAVVLRTDSRVPIRVLSSVGADPRGQRAIQVRPPLQPGDRVIITGRLRRPPPATNPGQFDYRRYLARRGVAALLSARTVDLISREPPSWWRRSAFRLREAVLGALERRVDSPGRDLLAGILIGEQSGLEPETRRAWTDAGVVHILVVSGSNVMFVALLGWWAFRRALFLPRKVALAGLVPVVVIYTLSTGAEPPAVRAMAMALLGITAGFIGREKDMFHLLLVAAAVILAADPAALFNAGFQMSFVATGAIILFASPVQGWLSRRRVPRFAATLLAATLSAQIGVTPLLAQYFHRVSVVAPLSNLLVGPATAAALYGAVGVVACDRAVPAAARPLGRALGWWMARVEELVEWFAGWPGAVLTVPPPLPAASRLWRRLVPGPLEVTWLDVGASDATLIRFPRGSVALVNGGGEGLSRLVGDRVVAPALWEQGVRRIRLLIVTTPAADHLTGLYPVLEKFGVDEAILCPRGTGVADEWDDVRAALERGGARVVIADRPEAREIDGAHVEVSLPRVMIRVAGILLPLGPESFTARPPGRDGAVTLVTNGKTRCLTFRNAL